MADILLVDDNGSVLLTLAIALRRRGHIVTVANEAFQALSELEHRHFDFLISDVRMPGMSGIQLASHAREMTQPPHVILTSAYSSVEAREGLAEAFLRKPIDIAQLDALLCAVTTGEAHERVQKAVYSAPASSPTLSPTTRTSL
jgi:CheY-like chemotaxis protein